MIKKALPIIGAGILIGGIAMFALLVAAGGAFTNASEELDRF